jgi:hypothetical protein
MEQQYSYEELANVHGWAYRAQLRYGPYIKAGPKTIWLEGIVTFADGFQAIEFERISTYTGGSRKRTYTGGYLTELGA